MKVVWLVNPSYGHNILLFISVIGQKKISFEVW